MFDYLVSGIVAVFLLVYLGWAMFQPETVLRAAMTTIGILQILLFFGLVLAVTKPVGLFMARVFEGAAHVPASGAAAARGARSTGSAGVTEDVEQRWTQYTALLLTFSLFAFLFPYLLQRLQGLLPLNPQGFRRGHVDPRPGVQHGRQLHDEHELAVVRRARPR